MSILFKIGCIMAISGGIIFLLFLFTEGSLLDKLNINLDFEDLMAIGMVEVIIGLVFIVIEAFSKKYSITIYNNKNDVVINYEHCHNIVNKEDGSITFYSNEIQYRVVLEPGQTIKSEEE